MPLLLFFVVLPGFEPRQTEPKPVVLPLHHRTILMCFLLKSAAKIEVFLYPCKCLLLFLFCYQQEIVLLATLHEQVFVVEQVLGGNLLVEGCELLLVERYATALGHLAHLALGGEYG